MGLYAHQKEMMRFSLSRLRSAYLADVGTGKTRPAILTFYLRNLKSGAKKCLVTCPSSIMHNWIDEIKLCNTGLKAVVIYAKGKQKREEILEQEADIYIINHDYLSTLKYPLTAKKFDFIIVDELTKFKHHQTKRSKALRHITKNIKYRLGLTGSPITQTPMDAFGEMLVIDPVLFGDNFFSFRGHYFRNIGTYFPLWIPIKDRLITLAQKLAISCLRLEKKDCLDLPPMVIEKRVLEMPKKMRSDYEQMREYLILEFENEGGLATATGEIVLKKLLRLSQITSGFIKSEEGEEMELGYTPKINELESLIEELEGKKVIVWAKFIRTIELLAERFKNLKPAVVWGGDKDMEHRYEEIKRFQTDPECKMFVGQISLGFGFNLTAADTMVYVEHNFSVEDRHQTKGRFDRIGQTAEKTTVIDLVMENSIDTYMLSSLKTNQNVADFIYDILRRRKDVNTQKA